MTCSAAWPAGIFRGCLKTGARYGEATAWSRRGERLASHLRPSTDGVTLDHVRPRVRGSVGDHPDHRRVPGSHPRHAHSSVRRSGHTANGLSCRSWPADSLPSNKRHTLPNRHSSHQHTAPPPATPPGKAPGRRTGTRDARSTQPRTSSRTHPGQGTRGPCAGQIRASKQPRTPLPGRYMSVDSRNTGVYSATR